MAKKIEVAIGILTNPEGKLLVGRRMSDPYAGKWEMPGGKVEDGETVLQALRREFKEEGGVELSEIYRWTRIESDERVLHLFRVFSEQEFVPKIYDAHDYVAHDSLLNLDWIETNRDFVKDLSEILSRDRKVGHIRFNPKSLEELRDTLNYLTNNLKSRGMFRRISCILHSDALLFPMNKSLRERVEHLHHQGVEFYAPLNIDIGLPSYIIKMRKEVTHV